MKMLWNNVGGKKEKTQKFQCFFLVGDNFGSSEDSSTIEYIEHGLIDLVYFKKCNLTLAVSPTCAQHNPFAYLLKSLANWQRIILPEI